MKRLVRTLAATMLLTTLPASAEKFENAYLSFNLPDGWQCQQEGTEFVCRVSNPSNKNNVAIMIMAAKEPGPDDTLAAYMEHLSKVAPAKGATVVKAPVQVNLQGTVWVDATLLGSEVPNYYTRYMATVKDDLAVLYTFSVHASRYQELSGMSTLAVQTLRVKSRKAR